MLWNLNPWENSASTRLEQSPYRPSFAEVTIGLSPINVSLDELTQNFAQGRVSKEQFILSLVLDLYRDFPDEGFPNWWN